MAKITFIIERLSYYKTLGGVIDEALKRNHTVSLMYNREQIGLTQKGIETPFEQNCPIFLFGKPNIVAFDGIKKLRDKAISISDVVVLHCGCVSDHEKFIDQPDTYPYQYQAIRKSGIPVVSLHSHFYDNCLLKLNAYSSVDLTCVLSEYAINLHKQVLTEMCDLKGKEKENYQKQIDTTMRNKVIVTGSALFDLFDQFYHQKKDTSKKTDIVLFYPKFTYRDVFMDIFARSKSRFVSAGISVYYYKGNYLSKIMSTPRFDQIIKQIERVSNSNNLNVITKSRPKHNSYHEKQLKKISSLYISGDSDQYYPEFTSMNILQHAKFCVHIRTSSVMESVIAGIPSVNIQIPNDCINRSKRYIHFVKHLRSHLPDTIFNYSGCVWNIPWKDSVSFFKNLNIVELEQNPKRRSSYIKYYCGINQRSASAKQMDAIETIL